MSNMNDRNPDPLDGPEEQTWGLAVPFVACESQGGPYDDQSFVAGVQVGKIEQALRTLAATGGDVYRATVYTPLVKQLDLIAMDCGFVVSEFAEIEETDDHPAMPEWSFVTIKRGAS